MWARPYSYILLRKDLFPAFSNFTFLACGPSSVFKASNILSCRVFTGSVDQDVEVSGVPLRVLLCYGREGFSKMLTRSDENQRNLVE